MQGTLWKWTNYISGWQSRWFVLESGILSYYTKQDEMKQGSRGSYKAASCEIRVDKHSDVAFCIITPDKASLHLKTGDKTERQKWVLALATAKMADTPVETPGQQESLISRSRPIKSKMADLRDTCSHLSTQVQSIKAASAQTPPDVKSMEALASTLTITCDDFLRLLQECLDHSNPATPIGLGGAFSVASYGLSSRFSEPDGPTPPINYKTLPTHMLETVSHDNNVRFNAATSDSCERRTHSRNNSDIFITPTGSPNLSSPPSPSTPHTSTPPPSDLSTRSWTVRERAKAYQLDRPLFKDYNPEPVERKLDTFFSGIQNKFGELVLDNGDKIPIKQFLLCSRELLPFFDSLSPTAFAPIKADISGNLDKPERKYQENPELYASLQALMEDEIQQGEASPGSATEGLLWFKRASQLIYIFVGEVGRGEAVDIAAGKAYSQSLRRHHNWLVRGAFSLALRAFPYYSDLLKCLGSDGSSEGDQQVVAEMMEFAQDLGEICYILDNFLTENNIESYE